MRTNPRRAHRVTPRTDRIKQLARERYGVKSVRALAAKLELDSITLYRILGGQNQPSATVIALLMTSFAVPFEELFAIEYLAPATPVAQAA